MARALSTQEQAAWDTGDVSVYVRILIDDGVSVRDLSQLRDPTDSWIKTVTWGDDIDNDLQTLTFTCHMRDGKYNLSPLDGGSPFNSGSNNILLELGNEVEVYVAIMPRLVVPVAADWKLVFDGTIEEVSVKDSASITVTCHDLTEVLRYSYVEEVRTYAGTFEAVCNSILSDWASGTVTVSGGPLTAEVKDYEQKREPVYSALKTLATQIGYAIRYAYDSSSNTFKLFLLNPDRAATTPDFTFDEDDWLGISFKTSRKDVRNVVQVIYYNGGDAELRNTVIAEDSTSTKSGRRWLEIDEGTTSQIDTYTEAIALANACLDDLQDPLAYFGVTLPFHYGVEIRDYVRLTAENRMFSADQTLAVSNVKHTINANQRASTVLSLSGLPKAGVKVWKERQATHSYKRIARRNLGLFTGKTINLNSNPVFDEGDQ